MRKFNKTEQHILDTLQNTPNAKLHIGWIDTRFYLVVGDEWETLRRTSIDLDKILPYLTRTECESWDEYEYQRGNLCHSIQ